MPIHPLSRWGWNLTLLIQSILASLALGVATSQASAVPIISTVAGGGILPSPFTNGIPATNAELPGLYGLATDLLGRVYLADFSVATVHRLNPTNGQLVTVAGTGTYGSSGDGGPAVNANFFAPQNVAVDLAGNFYIFDFQGGDLGMGDIRKVDVNTGVITTQVSTFSGAPPIVTPEGLAVDVHGNLYFGDIAYSVVRKREATNGFIHGIAGKAMLSGHAGDGGPATDALLKIPTRIAVDASDNVFILDQGNPTYVRRVDGVTGIITTVAGGGASDGTSGFATNASLDISINDQSAPAQDIAVDNLGSLYIAGPFQVWKVNLASGDISIIAGAAGANGGFSGDGGPATNALLYGGLGLAVSGTGDIYISDSSNARVRRVTPDTAPPFAVLVDLTVSQSCLLPQAEVRSNLYLATVNGRLALVLPNGTNVPGDVTLTNSTTLSAITVPVPAAVGGNLTITSSNTVDLTQLTKVGGGLVVTGNGLAVVSVGSPDVTGGLVVTANGTNIVSVGSPNVSGDATITGSTSGDISVGNPVVTGEATITGSTTGNVNVGNLSVTNDLTITGGTSGTVSVGNPTIGGDATITGSTSGNVNVGSATTTGGLKITGGNGNLTVGSATVLGGMTVSNGNGSITMQSPNVTGGLVVTSGESGDISIGSPDVSGSLVVYSGGGGNTTVSNGTAETITITNNGGSVTVQSPTVDGSVRLVNGNSTTNVVAGATVGTNLTVVAGDGSVAFITGNEVHGDVVVDMQSGATVTVSTNVVYGSVTIQDGSSSTMAVGEPAIAGNLTLISGAGSAIAVGSPVVEGDVTIHDGRSTTFTIGEPIVGGNLSLTTDGQTNVDISGAQVSGDTTLLMGDATSVSASTARGRTSLTLSNGPVVMQAVLPTGTFTTNVVFSVDSLAPAAVTTLGGPTNGDTFSVTTVAAYRFAFAIPTLNQDASLTFDIQLAALDAADRTAFLTALASGSAVVGVLGEAPGSTWQTFPICTGADVPSADGCVALLKLDDTGTPLPPDSTNAPAVVRFTGLAGHFSTWGVVVKQPVQLSTSLTGGGALRLAWRGPASGVLETSTNLEPNSWSPAGVPTQQSNGSWRFDVTPTEPARFYRFRSP